MSAIGYYKSYQTYKDEYSKWRDEKDLQYAKQQECIRLNPDLVETKDIQKSKTLLRAVDLMDELSHKKTENLEVVTGTVIDMGLQYAAVGGAALGYLLTKTGVAKNAIKTLSKNRTKTANLLTMSFTTLAGVLSTIAVFPLYNWASKSEAKAYRKSRHQIMKNELSNPRIFATLTLEQEEVLNRNLQSQEKTRKFSINPVKTFNDKIRQIKEFSDETVLYLQQKKDFENKLFEDEKFYNKKLTQEEIESAKQDCQILTKLVDKLNTVSQEYQEKSEVVTTSLVSGSFALGSLFSLGYERIMKRLKLKSRALPANFGLFLMLGASILSLSVQKKAAQIGRFKVKQELMEHPERLVYVSDEKTGEIKDVRLNRKKLSYPDFIKTVWKSGREYEKWKKESFVKEKNVSKAFDNLDLNTEQINEAKNLQRNMFKILSKMDDNTQKHAESIAVLGQAIQYPITIVLNTFAGLFGVKYLNQIANAKTRQGILNSSAKYISLILLSVLPSIIINNKIIRAEKNASQISDMLTLEGMQDYKNFADYSRFKK